jgi:uridine kinase
VGIAGGTGSGKTVLAGGLRGRFGNACIVDLDSYYVDRSHLSVGERNRVNYDEPEAIDVETLLRHVRDLTSGRAIRKPRYSFEEHCRVGTEEIVPAPLLIIEGLFVLWWPEMRSVLDLGLYVEAPLSVRLARRVRRDVADRGRSVESVLTQYFESVHPMHERYVEPTRSFAELVVTSRETDPNWAEPAFEAVRALFEGRGGREVSPIEDNAHAR